jgi:mannitol/fructose-specific phosphotransferase system IIA component (Ntr-type)
MLDRVVRSRQVFREGDVERFEDNLRQLAATYNFAFPPLPETVERSVEPVVRFLAATLVEQGFLRPDAEVMAVTAILDRERKGSTGIGRGLALPHATIPAGDRVMGAITFSKGGVAWSALDGQPVHWICLVLAPRDRTGDYLRVLQSFSETLKQATDHP